MGSLRSAVLGGVVYPVADWILDRRFPGLLREMEALSRRTPREIEEWQWPKLRSLVLHACRTTTYYASALARAGLHPERLAPEDWVRLPVLTKATVRSEFPTGLVSSTADRTRVRLRRTSGTTQQPLELYKDLTTTPYERATHVWLNSWVGLSRAARIVYMMLYQEPATRREWVWHALTGRRHFPYPPLLAHDGRTIVNMLNRLRPDAISGSPLLLELAALALKEGGLSLRRPPGVIIYHSAMMMGGVQELVGRAFGAPVVSRYGAIEFGSWLAQTCPAHAAPGRAGENLHVNNHRFRVEVLRADDTPARPGEEGRLIITDLANRVTPLIRYDLGDRGSLAPGPCSCGRGLQTLASLSGRQVDFVLLPSGRKLPGDLLYTAVRPHLELCWEYQFAQTHAGRLVLSVVPKGEGFDPVVRDAVRRALEAILAEPMTVLVQTVESIPFETSGKRPFLKPLPAADWMVAERRGRA